MLLYDIEILALKLIQILNLDLGVLLWLSFQIILSGHAIITNNTTEEGKEHVNLDYTLIRIFVVLFFMCSVFIILSEKCSCVHSCLYPTMINNILTTRLMLELAKYTQGQEIGNRLFM